jgi:hypothetical protein
VDDFVQKLKDIDSVKRQVIPVDWSKYRETFPEKYMKVSDFDHIVWNLHKQMVDHTLSESVHVLEVGGGTDDFYMNFFTHPDGSSKYWCIDPYCGKGCDWDSVCENIKFDLVLCRGTVGYLTGEQIKKMVKYAGDKGIIVMNNFFMLPMESVSSRYKSKQSEGIEHAYACFDFPSYPCVEHMLIPDDDNIPVIKHRMIFYSFQSIVKLAREANPNVKIASYLYKNNSIAIAIGENLSEYKIF